MTASPGEKYSQAQEQWATVGSEFQQGRLDRGLDSFRRLALNGSSCLCEEILRARVELLTHYYQAVSGYVNHEVRLGLTTSDVSASRGRAP